MSNAGGGHFFRDRFKWKVWGDVTEQISSLDTEAKREGIGLDGGTVNSTGSYKRTFEYTKKVR